MSGVEVAIPSQEERAALCEGKSPTDLRDLLFNNRVTINDVRRALALMPIPQGDAFYQSTVG